MNNEEMNKDRVIEYMLVNEKARYEAIKALAGSFKHIFITLIICITLAACFYMYFVVPVEEENLTADNGSQIIESSAIGRDNNYGR